MSELRFLDVSGVGNSGKSALVDLLREFDGIYVPHFQFEFDIIRVPGGLLDLRHALLEDWSPVRSHEAISRFRKKFVTMGLSPKPWDIPKLLKSSGQRYERHFGEQYFKLFEEFLESLVLASYRAEWPYQELEFSGSQRLAFRLARRFGFREAVLHNVLLVSGAEFDQKLQNVFQRLFEPLLSATEKTVVLNNGIEPFNPEPGLNMLGSSSRQIVVVRDPRDIYASGLNKTHGEVKTLQASDNDGFNKGFLATDDIRLFCERMKLHLQNLPKTEGPRVLKIWFEDLVTNPELTNQKVADFLELDLAHHSRKGEFLKPEKSRRMVGIASKLPDQQPVDFIAKELSEYLYPACP